MIIRRDVDVQLIKLKVAMAKKFPAASVTAISRGHSTATTTTLSEHIVAYLAKFERVSAQAYLLQAKLSQALLLQQGFASCKDTIIY